MKPKYIEMYMSMAKAAANASQAIRRKVGCVIVTKDMGVGVGMNGTPEGWHTNVCEYTENGELVTLPAVRHAEAGALRRLFMNRMDSRGSTVFLTDSPCIQCATRLHDAEVEKVYFENLYRITDGIEFLLDANIEVYRLIKEDHNKEYTLTEITKYDLPLLKGY